MIDPTTEDFQIVGVVVGAIVGSEAPGRETSRRCAEAAALQQVERCDESCRRLISALDHQDRLRFGQVHLVLGIRLRWCRQQ